MTALLASTTATSPTATEGDVKTYLANMREFIADLLGTDSANKAAVQGFLGNILSGKVNKTASYTVVATDRGKVIDCTGTWTMNIAAAAMLGDGFSFAIRNSGTGAITIDPNLSEAINGLTAFVIGGGEFVIVYCDGIGFSTVGGASAPVGTVMPTALSNAPVGWLLCYGQAISRTSYASLFNAIGLTYGSGDGTTTFNVPDLRGRVVAGNDKMGGIAANRLTSPVAGGTLGAVGGAQTHTLLHGEMPSHTHAVTPYGYGSSDGGPVPSMIGSVNATSVSQTGSAGGGSAHNNVQPTIVLNYMIKT